MKRLRIIEYIIITCLIFSWNNLGCSDSSSLEDAGDKPTEVNFINGDIITAVEGNFYQIKNTSNEPDRPEKELMFFGKVEDLTKALNLGLVQENGEMVFYRKNAEDVKCRINVKDNTIQSYRGLRNLSAPLDIIDGVVYIPALDLAKGLRIFIGWDEQRQAMVVKDVPGSSESPMPVPMENKKIENNYFCGNKIKQKKYKREISGVIPQAVAFGWRLETIIPPPKTANAIFDVVVMPDGKLLTLGNSGRMISIDNNGVVQPTPFEAKGAYFEASNDGRLWSYNIFSGELYAQNPDEGFARKITQLPQCFAHGSFAVSPDGKNAYMMFWRDVGGDNTVLYRYNQEGLKEIIQASAKDSLLSVEASADGRVYVANRTGIFVLLDNGMLKPIHEKIGLGIMPDSLTSDSEGNFYFFSEGNRGIYKLTSQGELKKLVDFDKGDPAVLGMAFDNKNKVLFAAQKTNQEVLRITENGAEELLGSAGLTTPIALAINNNGEVFVNGDEVGVLKINLDSGEVSEYKTGLVCFQPPPAGMVFDKDGLLYYTEAAPGFPSRIITVDSSGKISVITQDVGCPAGIAIDNNGEVIYADYQNGAVYKLGKNGLSVTIVAGLSFPVGVVVGRDDAIYVATALPGTKGDPRSLNEPFRGSIIKYTKGSGIKEVYRTDSNLSFFDVDLNGNLYIPDGNRLVVRYVDGRIETIANGFQWVRDAKIAKDGSIYVTDYSASALYRLKREVVN